MNEALSISSFVNESVSRYLSVWQKLPGSYIDLENERIYVGSANEEAESLIDCLFDDLKSNNRELLFDDDRAKALFSALFNCSPDVILSKPFKRASHEFVHAAKRFDAGLSENDIYQAIRNLWIANSIQYLFDKKIDATPPLFAYSMLYPYSDNLLDDSQLSVKRKKEFNSRFRARLKGEKIKPSVPLEYKTFQLIEMIEGFYGRDVRPMVYDCLLAIQKGQEKSGLLNSGMTSDYETVCEVTFEKGGTSVLADGCLVCGQLDSVQADFLMGYGIFLQLIDDLQDIAEDCRQCQSTLFTINPGRHLDEMAARMIRFMFFVIDEAKLAMPGKSSFFLMIENCCLTLAYRSIFNNIAHFSDDFLYFIEFKGGFSKEFYERQKCKFKELSRNDVDSLLKGLAAEKDIPKSVLIDHIKTF